jgi:flagellar hook-associated protein 1 FlgK
MSISFFGLDTALSGLFANQKALEVTGHNVSNLGTPGFSRQSAIMASAATRSYGNNWVVEMGCDVQEIRQIRHIFNDNIFRTESNALGYWESRYKAVTDLESILGEPMKQGFQVAMNNFWDSFQELSKAPESLTIRALVKQRADSLANYLNHVGSQIDKLQSDLNNEIKLKIDEVNTITQKIAKLNVDIMSAVAAGNSPNDYLDQRNYLVDQLSKLVKCETWYTQEGSMDVLLDGYYLVSKGRSTNLVAEPNGEYSHFYTPKLYDPNGNIDIDVGQGIIKGLLEARGEVNGAKDSYDNGSPNTTADVTIAVDISDTSASYLANVKDQVEALAKDLEKRGLNYNLRLVLFGGSGAVTNVNYGRDAAALCSAIPDTPDAGNSNNFADVINAVNSNSYGKDVNKYLMVFTNESLDGDETTTDSDDTTQYLNTLKKLGMTVSIATNPIYHDQGNAGEAGWGFFAEQTGGKLYDIGTADYKGLMEQISKDINGDVNMKMSTVPDNLNIISSVKRQLNALINIMAREINYLHLSGKTLTGADGGLFFEAANSTMPIQMGNIKVNDALKDVNYIAASTIDANGDNTIALAIANLRNAELMTGNNKVLSLDTYYQNLIMDVGNKGNEAAGMMESYQLLVQQADAMRQSIMGVSLDEEMTNMIKFKYAYNANSKVIDVVNQMLETIIFRLGA